MNPAIAVWDWNALSGLSVTALRYPGRCPGLKLDRPYGAESKIWVALRGGDIISSAAGRAKPDGELEGDHEDIRLWRSLGTG
jgi:hypothetical protein